MTIQFNGILRALVAAIILAALSTLGDFLWAHHGIKHRMFAGILHGALLCLCLGAVLGYSGKHNTNDPVGRTRWPRPWHIIRRRILPLAPVHSRQRNSRRVDGTVDPRSPAPLGG